MSIPWVSRKVYESACKSALDAYDRLDALLGENEKLIRAAERAHNRYESLVLRMLEMKREGFARPKPLPEQPTTTTDQPPAVIQAALDNTFPGDAGIYALNTTYALSQKHRWKDEADKVALEITNGR